MNSSGILDLVNFSIQPVDLFLLVVISVWLRTVVSKPGKFGRIHQCCNSYSAFGVRTQLVTYHQNKVCEVFEAFMYKVVSISILIVTHNGVEHCQCECGVCEWTIAG